MRQPIIPEVGARNYGLQAKALLKAAATSADVLSFVTSGWSLSDLFTTDASWPFATLSGEIHARTL